MKNIKIKSKILFESGKIRFRLMALILIIPMLTTFSQCPTVIPPEGNRVKPDGSATLELQGVATVNFPPDSFSPDQELDIAQTSDPETGAIFDEFSLLFRVSNKLSYEVRVNTGIEHPKTENFEVIINLPDDFVASMPDNHGIELYAQVYSDNGMEILDNFVLFSSEYNPENQVLKAELPGWIFTNMRRNDQTYEAILTIAATPGTNIPQIGVSEFYQKSEIDSNLEEERCKAFPIICPLENRCTISSPNGEFGVLRGIDEKEKKVYHRGIDLKVVANTPVYAVADGTIERVWVEGGEGSGKGYGLYIILRHKNEAATLYAHLNNTYLPIQSSVDDDYYTKRNNYRIYKGQLIGWSGGQKGHKYAGNSHNPHLHFEYVPNGEIIQSKERINALPCIDPDPNIEGSLIIRDNGSLQDDAFEAYLNGNLIGSTEPGGSSQIALHNLRPGTFLLKIKCTLAPDDVGTLEIVLNEGIEFLDGTTWRSVILSQGGEADFYIEVPR